MRTKLGFFVAVALVVSSLVGCADILGLELLVETPDAAPDAGSVPDAATTDN